MARHYPASTIEQRQWEETIFKERDAQIEWFERLKRERSLPSMPNKSSQVEVCRRKIENRRKNADDIIPDTMEKQDPLRFHRRQMTFCAPSKISSTDIVNEMLSCPKSTRKLLYKGFSHEGLGRSLYLRERSEIIPEKKYVFPILSSWDYGWQMGRLVDVSKCKAPKHAKNRIVAETFYRRNGVEQYSA